MAEPDWSLKRVIKTPQIGKHIYTSELTNTRWIYRKKSDDKNYNAGCVYKTIKQLHDADNYRFQFRLSCETTGR